MPFAREDSANSEMTARGCFGKARGLEKIRERYRAASCGPVRFGCKGHLEHQDSQTGAEVLAPEKHKKKHKLPNMSRSFSTSGTKHRHKIRSQTESFSTSKTQHVSVKSDAMTPRTFGKLDQTSTRKSTNSQT